VVCYLHSGNFSKICMILGGRGASRTGTALIYANSFLKKGAGEVYDIAMLVSHNSAYKFAPLNVTKALLEVEIYLHLSLNSTLDIS
jgi:hypothetical protein